jgi:DNA-binding NarL/FixJ family response regulator
MTQKYFGAVRRFLQEQQLVDLIGESSDFAESVRMVSDLTPDAVILDLHMVPKSTVHEHDRNNICKARRLLVISASADQESRDLADAAGADAFLDKMDLQEKLIAAIVWLSSDASAHAIRVQ